MRPVHALLLYAALPENETLSYQRAWPRHMQAHPRFRCTPLNVLDPGQNRRFRLRRRMPGRTPDAVIVLHSVFSNGRYLTGRLFDAIRRLRAPKAWFIGNEYKGMPEKMWFGEELGVDLLVSQFTTGASLRLYRERLGCRVVGIPNSGWDRHVFRPRRPTEQRPLDLGYRAFDNGFELGHRERRELADRFLAAASDHGLAVDISLDPRRRFDERGWADFLNRCKAQIGSEAGGDYFELTDSTRERVLAYRAQHPDATFEEVWERFFRDYRDPVPGRALSGRHVEAAGAKCTQVLLEGEYGGYLRPDEHYIPLRKDFSDLDEAIAKLRDADYSRRIRDAAHELVARELTYERLIDRFHDELAPLLG